MCIEDYPKRELLIHPSSRLQLQHKEWILISPGVKTINPNDLDNHILNEWGMRVNYSNNQSTNPNTVLCMNRFHNPPTPHTLTLSHMAAEILRFWARSEFDSLTTLCVGLYVNVSILFCFLMLFYSCHLVSAPRGSIASLKIRHGRIR